MGPVKGLQMGQVKGLQMGQVKGHQMGRVKGLQMGLELDLGDGEVVESEDRVWGWDWVVTRGLTVVHEHCVEWRLHRPARKPENNQRGVK